VTEFEPRIWTVKIPPPMEFIRANDRRGLWGNAGAVRAWRTAAWAAAGRGKLPKGLARARIDITICPASGGLDDDALRPTCKAIVDGLGPPFMRKPNPAKGYRGAAAPGYGLIPDDNPKHLDGYHLHLQDPQPPRGAVTVTVVDLAGVPAGRTWTPDFRTATGGRITVKRCCNGCGRRLGDVTDDEIDAAVGGLPLPDITGECPSCADAEVA